MQSPDPTPTPTPTPHRTWTLVLPVQHPARAKSRLQAPSSVERAALARAIALDSLAAVRATPGVARRVVVTADDDLARRCAAAGDTVVRDDGHSLTAAIGNGVDVALADQPEAAIAVLLPDVPALTAGDLATALDAASQHAFAVVPDAEGTGSVLLTAVPGGLLRPAFGADSARRHRDLGAHLLDLDLPRLRRDVDTRAGLVQAAGLGLGPATRAALGDAADDLLREGRACTGAH